MTSGDRVHRIIRVERALAHEDRMRRAVRRRRGLAHMVQQQHALAGPRVAHLDAVREARRVARPGAPHAVAGELLVRQAVEMQEGLGRQSGDAEMHGASPRFTSASKPHHARARPSAGCARSRLSGREHVDDAVRDHVPRARAVFLHVRRRAMRVQGRHALPFLDDDEAVRPERGLHRAGAFRIDRRPVLDAALLGPHVGDVGVEFPEHRLPLPGLRRDHRQHMDHANPPFMARAIGPVMDRMRGPVKPALRPLAGPGF